MSLSDGAFNFSCALTIADARDCALPEFHDVLRQRAGFVTEDVLDLAELLREICRATVCGSVRVRKINFFVRLDAFGLKRFDNFCGDVERNRNGGGKEDQK